MKKKRRWIKWGLIGLVGLLPATDVQAQSIADDITQLVLDVQKLSQLKQILSDMQQAYTIVSKGYDAIKDLSQGTFNLHKAFLDGLLAVSPVVGNYARVADIIAKEASLVQEYQSASLYFQGSGHFTGAELNYFSNVYTNLLAGSVKNVSELIMVVTAGQLRMGDAERLGAIDRIDRDITGQLSFMKSFDNTAALQDQQRVNAGQDVGSLRALYGIGP